MPRRTPIKELQETEETVVGSPLRRSTRLQQNQAPTRILTRRTSATDSSNTTPVTAVKTRRASFTSDTAEQKTTAEKQAKSTPMKGRRDSKSEDDVQTPAKEKSELENSVKNVTRRSSIRTETTPIKEQTPADSKRITRSSSLPRATEPIMKPMTRRRSSSVQEVIYEENIQTEENNEEIFVEEKTLKETITNKDANLSIIKESSFNEINDEESEKVIIVSSDKENISPEKNDKVQEINVFQPKLSDSVIANLTMEPMEVDEENSITVAETVIKNASTFIEKLTYEIENATNLIQEDEIEIENQEKPIETKENKTNNEEDMFLSDFVDEVQEDESKSDKDGEGKQKSDKNESESEHVEFEILSEEEEKVIQIEDKTETTSAKKSCGRARLSLRKVELKLLSDNEDDEEKENELNNSKKKDKSLLKKISTETNESEEEIENRSNNSIYFNDTKFIQLNKKTTDLNEIESNIDFDKSVLNKNKETDKSEDFKPLTEVESEKNINKSFRDLNITQTDEINKPQIKNTNASQISKSNEKEVENNEKWSKQTPITNKSLLESFNDPMTKKKDQDILVKSDKKKLNPQKTPIKENNSTDKNEDFSKIEQSENKTPAKENEKEYDDYNSPIKTVTSLKCKRTLMDSEEEEINEPSVSLNVTNVMNSTNIENKEQKFSAKLDDTFISSKKVNESTNDSNLNNSTMENEEKNTFVKLDDSFITKRKTTNSLNKSISKKPTVEENNEAAKEEPTKTKTKKFSLDKTSQLKLNKLVEEIILNGTDEEVEEEEHDDVNEFINDMAEEGEEDTPSEDSNDIIEVGEKINTSDSEWSESEDYAEEEDSDNLFINDEETELLSGNEYDLNSANERKSRILTFSSHSEDEGEEIVKIVRKQKVKKPKIRSRIIELEDSSDEDIDENKQIKECIVKDNEDKIHKESQIQININQLNQEILKKKNDLSVKETEDNTDTLDGDSVDDPDKKIEKSPRKKSEESPKKSSIIIHENIRVDEIKDKDFTNRINSVVELFCSKINKKGEVKLNVSLDYAEKSSDDDDKQESMQNINQNAQEKTEQVKLEHVEKKRKKRNRRKKLKQELLLTGEFKTSRMENEQKIEDKKSKKVKKQDKKKSINQESTQEKKAKKRLSDELVLDEPKKKLVKIDTNEKKSKEKPKKKKKENRSPIQNLKSHTLSILNELVLDQKKVTNQPSNSDWKIEDDCNIKPSTSSRKVDIKRKICENIKVSKSEDDVKKLTFHAKDFKNQMLFNPSRVKRCDTKEMMKNRGVQF